MIMQIVKKFQESYKKLPQEKRGYPRFFACFKIGTTVTRSIERIVSIAQNF